VYFTKSTTFWSTCYSRVFCRNFWYLGTTKIFKSWTVLLYLSKIFKVTIEIFVYSACHPLPPCKYTPYFTIFSLYGDFAVKLLLRIFTSSKLIKMNFETLKPSFHHYSLYTGIILKQNNQIDHGIPPFQAFHLFLKYVLCLYVVTD
jgi:hypothetical protein